MYPAIANYNITLSVDCRFRRGEATYREWRLPDAFGDPGKLVRRQFLSLRVDGVTYSEPNPIIQGARFNIQAEELAKQPVWETEDSN